MRVLTCLAFLVIGAGTAVAKECRTPDVPPGVRVQMPPGCDDPIRTGAPKDTNRDYMKADQGFVDLGNGTKVRVGGRVRVETSVRR
jgi:hypothetical protein